MTLLQMIFKKKNCAKDINPDSLSLGTPLGCSVGIFRLFLLTLPRLLYPQQIKVLLSS